MLFIFVHISVTSMVIVSHMTFQKNISVLYVYMHLYESMSVPMNTLSYVKARGKLRGINSLLLPNLSQG